MEAMKHFPKKLKELREGAGLNQSQLADKLGVSRGSISFYENGERVPDIEFLAGVAKYFSVSADWLIGPSTVKSPDVDLRRVCEYTGLTEEAVKHLHCDFIDHPYPLSPLGATSKTMEDPDFYRMLYYAFRAASCEIMEKEHPSKKIIQFVQNREEKIAEDLAQELEGFHEIAKEAADMSGDILLDNDEHKDYFLYKAQQSASQVILGVFEYVKECYEENISSYFQK